MKVISLSQERTRAGFTLVEILVVISIMVVLMAMTFGIGGWAMKNAKVQKANTQVKLFENKLQEYEVDNGEFPPGDGSERSSISLYQTLYENGIQNGTKVYMPELDPDSSDQFKRKIEKDGTILDPFKYKNPYYYLRGIDENGNEVGNAFNPDFDLWSLGPNGVGRGKGGNSDEDLDDDITNWDG
ncbi:prepilin-type N-terminal cleavage/methylation domain-containing protein [Roseibacillus ishigakijimensis]|uniref:Type II secretion system protein GspG n=1 Tax=Roseibacillus ishigakijimensis TaxID=454146 RepID=A0A934RKA6_9BACT|nr:prepilin-type N-terminal cleavage/methylation domain-containing protein [Roseibacillus ishigakijimensis]MBK1832994.1 type II secretion system protein GspG [Roseibacillus ishigakijimensis]